MTHTELQELAAGAALDDLDPVERSELDEHLAGCAGCRALATDLAVVLGDLALVAPELHPPEALQASVMAAIRALGTGGSPLALASSGGLTVTARPGRPMPRQSPIPGAATSARAATSSPRLGVLGALGLAAVLTVVAVGLGIRAAHLDDAIATRDAAMAVIADPAHLEADLHAEPIAPDALARVVFRPGSTDAYLMATELPATPAGHVYQLWVADAAGVHALGTFRHDGGGPFIAPFGVDLAASTAAMVTLEPDGGAQGEPGPQVVFGEL